MNARRSSLLAGIAAGVLLAASARAQSGKDSIRVIVHATNPIKALDRRTVADIYLKRTTFWPDGELIRPVDLDPRNKARRLFSARILDRSVASVRTYWQQRIFSGRGLPPPELAGDAQVIEFVAHNPGAIGYISDRPLPKSVREIKLR